MMITFEEATTLTKQALEKGRLADTTLFHNKLEKEIDIIIREAALNGNSSAYFQISTLSYPDIFRLSNIRECIAETYPKYSMTTRISSGVLVVTMTW